MLGMETERPAPSPDDPTGAIGILCTLDQLGALDRLHRLRIGTLELELDGLRGAVRLKPEPAVVTHADLIERALTPPTEPDNAPLY